MTACFCYQSAVSQSISVIDICAWLPASWCHRHQCLWAEFSWHLIFADASNIPHSGWWINANTVQWLGSQFTLGMVLLRSDNQFWSICGVILDNVIKWEHFPRYWPFVRGIHRNRWRGTLMFSLICAWINVWVNNREASDLRRHCVLYDVI